MDIEALQQSIKEFQEQYGFVITAEKTEAEEDEDEDDPSGQAPSEEESAALQQRYKQLQAELHRQQASAVTQAAQGMASGGRPQTSSQAPLGRPRVGGGPQEAYRR